MTAHPSALAGPNCDSLFQRSHGGAQFRLRLRLSAAQNYDPSDATLLPDGRILVLNRRFALPFNFTAKLTIIDPKAIRPGARVNGEEIAPLNAPLLHDNFEGLAVRQEGPDTVIWIVSDDNQLFLRRSLLLKFRLDRNVLRRWSTNADGPLFLAKSGPAILRHARKVRRQSPCRASCAHRA
uniref:esterase-like activity of phytase family protein n=1 Tax=Sphingomonas sp. TaxID=28214 RepID=UPI0025CF9787|nr:esterase-like activity of phytase family protein [Sphingomonas sp.]